MQPTRILCPTDWSAPSRVALRAAVGMARVEGAELLLLHVLPPLENVPGIASVASLREAIKQESLQKLTALIGELVPPDVHVTPLVRFREEADEIVRIALGCDVVVMNTRGRAGWARLALGSGLRSPRDKP